MYSGIILKVILSFKNKLTKRSFATFKTVKYEFSNCNALYASLTLLNLSKSKSKISYKNLPKDDPKRRNPDISLANRNLNWNPKCDLQNGLLNTIKYFKGINAIN